MPVPTIQHRLEYALTRGVESAVSVLPDGMAQRVGVALGGFVGWPLGIRRSTVEANLRRAFPAADDGWIDATVRATYRHLGREVVAMLRLSRLDRKGVLAATEIDDAVWQTYLEALEEGRGAILATGHYGNWEMAAAAVAARGHPIEAIVKRQSNRLVDERIEAARRALGIETVDMREAPRRIPRALAAGRTIGIVADQDARRAGVFVPFFGVPASTHRGPALFALRLNAPLFGAVARRLPDGRYRVVAERLEVERTDDLEADVTRLTTALARHLEKEIREDPAQYFWLHKRWKTPAPEEPAPPSPGTMVPDGG
jgi:Kdo2-lipid IVA lauroyltransferase/acyltransferase